MFSLSCATTAATLNYSELHRLPKKPGAAFTGPPAADRRKQRAAVAASAGLTLESDY